MGSFNNNKFLYLVVLLFVFSLAVCSRCTLAASRRAIIESEDTATTNTELSIRIAIFADLPLVQHLEKNLGLSSARMKENLLQAYVAQMDALFAGLSSELISRIHLRLARVHYEQEAGQFTGNLNSGSASSVDLILGSFCLYQEAARTNQNWDFALLLTSRDIGDDDEESAEQAASLLGMSPIGGIQWPDLSCAVVEFGARFNESSSPMVSREKSTTGMASAWVAAHELGHNLGLHHDGQPFNEDCPDDGEFMMAKYSLQLNAPVSRHKWSNCSSKELNTLDLSKFSIHNSTEEFPLPGRLLDLDQQCKIFGGEKFRAQLASDGRFDCAGPIMCLTQDHDRPVPIGAALEGTRCSSQSKEYHCMAGSCIAAGKPACSPAAPAGYPASACEHTRNAKHSTGNL